MCDIQLQEIKRLRRIVREQSELINKMIRSELETTQKINDIVENSRNMRIKFQDEFNEI